MTAQVILVFGANGRLGSELVERLKRDQHAVVGLTREDLDLCCIGRIRDHIIGLAPDVVINAAAMNGMEACVNDPTQALLINSVAVSAMAAACKKLDALFIHFSTDYVFSGDDMGLTETSPIKPCGVYGKTKWWGEESVKMIDGRYLIFRLSSLYGRKFEGVLQPIQQVLDGKGVPGNPVRVLHQFCAPTSTRLVADAVAHALKGRPLYQGARLVGAVDLTPPPQIPTGIYHLSTSTGVWKTDFTRYLLAATGIPTCLVEEGRLAEDRPIRSRLVSKLFEDTFDYKLPDWKTDLNAMLPLLPEVKLPATV